MARSAPCRYATARKPCNLGNSSDTALALVADLQLRAADRARRLASCELAGATAIERSDPPGTGSCSVDRKRRALEGDRERYVAKSHPPHSPQPGLHPSQSFSSL